VLPINLAIRSFRQVLAPAFRGVLWRSIGLTLALLVVLGIGFTAGAEWLGEHYGPWIGATAALITGSAYLFLGAYLVAPVSTLVAGFFLDEVAAEVERTDYRADPPGTALPFTTALWLSARFALIVAAVNVVALLLLLVPGVNAVIFLVANAYLLGREYFELAAGRFRGPEAARELRRRHAVKVFVAGLIVALVLAIPILNLLTPLFGTVLMVHLHKRLPA